MAGIVVVFGLDQEGDSALDSGIVVGIAYPLGLSERINFHSPFFDIDIRHGCVCIYLYI